MQVNTAPVTTLFDLSDEEELPPTLRYDGPPTQRMPPSVPEEITESDILAE